VPLEERTGGDAVTLYRVFRADCDFPRCYEQAPSGLGRVRKSAVARLRDDGWKLLARSSVIVCPKHNTEELRGGHTPVLEAAKKFGRVAYRVHCACGFRHPEGELPSYARFVLTHWHDHLIEAWAAAGDEYAITVLRRRAEYAAESKRVVEEHVARMRAQRAQAEEGV
jgi:hypothetical protein